MRGLGRIGGRAVEIGLVTEKHVVEALKFQRIARIENGLDIGIGEALLWQSTGASGSRPRAGGPRRSGSARGAACASRGSRSELYAPSLTSGPSPV
jgi:hypothetical protein